MPTGKGTPIGQDAQIIGKHLAVARWKEIFLGMAMYHFAVIFELVKSIKKDDSASFASKFVSFLVFSSLSKKCI